MAPLFQTLMGGTGGCLLILDVTPPPQVPQCYLCIEFGGTHIETYTGAGEGHSSEKF